MNHGTLTANTSNKHLNVLAMVFRVLKRKAKLADNPWEEIPRKRNVARGRRELTLDELKKVCQAAAGELRTLFAVGIYIGLREGDCATMRWAEVELQRSVIRRVPNKTARRNPKPVIIPIHPVLREMLTEYVLPKTADDYLHRPILVCGFYCAVVPDSVRGIPPAAHPVGLTVSHSTEDGKSVPDFPKVVYKRLKEEGSTSSKSR